MSVVLAVVAASCFVSMVMAIGACIRLAEKLECAETTIHRLRREKILAFVQRHAAPAIPPWVNHREGGETDESGRV